MIRDESLALISHDLHTSLNAIIGFSGMLLMELPGPINANQEDQLRIIQSSANALRSQIDSLLDAAGKPSGTAISLEPTPIIDNEPPRPVDRIVARALILYIDDDPNCRKLMACLLESYGHKILIAEGGEQGLKMARLNIPDLILCDVQMSTCSGFDVARELKSDPVLRHIPLVAMTATSLLRCHDEFPAAAFDYSILKPIHPDKLAVQLESILERGAVARQSPELISGSISQTP